MELSGFSVASDAICRPSKNCLTRTSAREAIIKAPLLPWYRGLAPILGPSAVEILLEHLNDEPDWSLPDILEQHHRRGQAHSGGEFAPDAGFLPEMNGQDHV